MSVKAVRAVLDTRADFTDAEFIALLAIAEHADEDGECYPSMERIAGYLARGKRQTRRIITGLVEDGLLSRVARSKGGRQTSNQYRLDLARLAEIRRAGGRPEESEEVQGGHPDDRPGGHPDDRGGRTSRRPGGGGHLDDRPMNHQKEPPGENTPPPPKGGAAKKAAKKEAKEITDPLLAFPEDWRTTESFTEAWRLYLQMRKEKRQSPTPTALQQLTKKLLEAGIEKATMALAQSTANCWTGCFPEKQVLAKTNGRGPEQKTDLESTERLF